MAADSSAILRARLQKKDADTIDASVGMVAIRGGAASAVAIHANAAAAISVAFTAITVMSAPSTACLRLVRQPEAGQRHPGKTGAEFLQRRAARNGLCQALG